MSDDEYQRIRAVISNAYYDARNAGRTMEDAASEAAGVVQAMIAGAVEGSLDGFGDYLMVKAENAEGRTGEATYSDGMRNAAVDAGLWTTIRDHWQDGQVTPLLPPTRCAVCDMTEIDHGDHGECLVEGHEGRRFTYPEPPEMPPGDDPRSGAPFPSREPTWLARWFIRWTERLNRSDR